MQQQPYSQPPGYVQNDGTTYHPPPQQPAQAMPAQAMPGQLIPQPMPAQPYPPAQPQQVYPHPQVYPQAPYPAAPMMGQQVAPDGMMRVRVKKYRMGAAAWCMVVLLILCFWPLCWLPCVCKDCHDEYEEEVLQPQVTQILPGTGQPPVVQQQPGWVAPGQPGWQPWMSNG